MGRADYLKLGGWNAICDRCGRKFKNYELSRTWDGLMVCGEDWEPRHPQDYVRAGRPEGNIPWARPDAQDIVLGVCSPQTVSALPDIATAECAICEFIHPQFDPAEPDLICSFSGSSAYPGGAIPGCVMPSFISPYI